MQFTTSTHHNYTTIQHRHLSVPPPIDDATTTTHTGVIQCIIMIQKQRTISMCCIVIPNLIRCAYQLSNNKTNLSCRSAASYLNCVAVIGLPAAHNKLRHRRGDIFNGATTTSFITFSLSLYNIKTTSVAGVLQSDRR